MVRRFTFGLTNNNALRYSGWANIFDPTIVGYAGILEPTLMRSPSTSRRSRPMRSRPNGTLEQAMALLIQNQAAFVAQLGENQKKFLELESRMARVERSLEEIKATLSQHDKAFRELAEVLVQLPEAVRQKIGFKPGA